VRKLLPVEAVPGSEFVDALRRAWDAGDAVLPVDPRLPGPARQALFAAARLDEPVADGDALVVATSGTTGEPKCAVLTHDAVRAGAEVTSAGIGADPATDRWLCVLPLAHVAGLAVVARSLVTGIALTFDPDEPATLTVLVPTLLQRMDAGRFRRILLGGAAPPRHPPANCIVTYGMTETFGGVVYDGRPLAGVEVRALDGELHVRCPMLLRCYRDGSDPKDPDGWYATGDGGRVADGVVHVDGRLGDVIVTGGEKVWPDPVERIIRTLPGVSEVGVAGRPDPEWGDRVVAWILPDGDPPSLEQVRDAVRAELPAWWAPKDLVLVDALPRTSLGKVRRSELR
jgi:O-succinylbenzoic acid--CoA ligase